MHIRCDWKLGWNCNARNFSCYGYSGFSLTNPITVTTIGRQHTWTYLMLTFRNQFDSTIFHCVQSMSASSVLNRSNIVDTVRDSMYRQLSLYTDRISVDSTSHIMLLRMSMQFCHYYMYSCCCDCSYTMLKLLWSMMIFLVLSVKPNRRKYLV